MKILKNLSHLIKNLSLLLFMSISSWTTAFAGEACSVYIKNMNCENRAEDEWSADEKRICMETSKRFPSIVEKKYAVTTDLRQSDFIVEYNLSSLRGEFVPSKAAQVTVSAKEFPNVPVKSFSRFGPSAAAFNLAHVIQDAIDSMNETISSMPSCEVIKNHVQKNVRIFSQPEKTVVKKITSLNTSKCDVWDYFYYWYHKDGAKETFQKRILEKGYHFAGKRSNTKNLTNMLGEIPVATLTSSVEDFKGTLVFEKNSQSPMLDGFGGIITSEGNIPFTDVKVLSGKNFQQLIGFLDLDDQSYQKEYVVPNLFMRGFIIKNRSNTYDIVAALFALDASSQVEARFDYKNREIKGNAKFVYKAVPETMKFLRTGLSENEVGENSRIPEFEMRDWMFKLPDMLPSCEQR